MIVQVVGVIADIVESRSIEDRETFQRALESVLGELNDRSRSAIASPYTVTIGDEFQALHRDFSRVLSDVVYLAWRIHPVRIRVAVGHGELWTDLNESAAIGMDGPVFHGARELLDRLKPHDSTVVQIACDTPIGDLINAALMLVSGGLASWSATTLGTLSAMLDGLRVKETSPRVSVTDRAVYKVIATHGLAHHRDLLVAIAAELDRWADAAGPMGGGSD